MKKKNICLVGFKIISIIDFWLSHLLEVPRLVHSGRDDLHYLRQVERTDTENTERASALLVVGQPTVH
jgi:hypothetical protein